MAEGNSNYKLLLSMIMFMLVLTVLSIISGNNFSSVNINDTYTAVVNGTTTEFDVSDAAFSIDVLEGAIGWLVLIAAIGVAAGITVVATGLSEASVNLLYKSIFYGVVWGLLSVFPSGLMFSIPLFGGLAYITLTIVYVVAVLMVI